PHYPLPLPLLPLPPPIYTKFLHHLQRSGPKLETQRQAVWRLANLPLRLQGRTGSVPTPTSPPPPSPPAATPAMGDRGDPEQTNALALPSEVQTMRATLGDWRSAWRVQGQEQLGQVVEQGGRGQGHYLRRLMINRQEAYPRNQAREAAVPPAVYPFQQGATHINQYLQQSDHDTYREKIKLLREADHRPPQSSRQTQSFRNANTVTHDPQVAADRLVRSLKEKVMQGEMELSDTVDWAQLMGGDLRSADVLLDFTQLRVPLQELFVYFRPGACRTHQLGKIVWGMGPMGRQRIGPVGGWNLPPALNAEQRNELVQELFEWSRANSILFLQARYRDQPEKLGMLLGEGGGKKEEEEGEEDDEGEG
ncbi:hypothetical protein B484DRAFT_33508, partial [Ochromonadaceae sp. CCMP2298]